MGAAAVMGGAAALDNLLSGNGNSIAQEQVRRASTPGTTANTGGGGGFSSIFNLKSVISAATKTSAPSPQPTPASNFYVTSPPVAPEPMNSDLHMQTQAAAPQKSIQGIVQVVVGRFRWFVLVCFCAFSVCSDSLFDEILF